MNAARLLAPAEEELATAMRWYEERRPGLGVEFLGAVHAVLMRVATCPQQFPVWTNNQRFRRALVDRFPYSLFFHVVEDVPVVVAIAHMGRRPGYWLIRGRERPEER